MTRAGKDLELSSKDDRYFIDKTVILYRVRGVPTRGRYAGKSLVESLAAG